MWGGHISCDCHVQGQSKTQRKRILSDVDGKSSKVARTEASRKISEFFKNCSHSSTKEMSTQVKWRGEVGRGREMGRGSVWEAGSVVQVFVFYSWTLQVSQGLLRYPQLSHPLGYIHSHPIPWDIHSYPIPWDIHSYPIPWDIHSYPIPWDIHSYPIPWDILSYPIPWDIHSCPIPWHIHSYLIPWDILRYPIPWDIHSYLSYPSYQFGIGRITLSVEFQLQNKSIS